MSRQFIRSQSIRRELQDTEIVPPDVAEILARHELTTLTWLYWRARRWIP